MQERPFFCLITTNAPHSPHIVPERFTQPYRDLVARDPAAAEFFNTANNDQMLKFYGMVTCIDENVGALRSRIEQLGLAENTIFIFMTDNGSAGGLVRDREQFIRHGFNAGMRGGKGTPWEGGHRVPFFLHWPAGELATGRDMPQLTANVDIAPTLLELCGVSIDSGAFHGRSLARLLAGGRTGDRGVWPERAIVTDSQRLLHPVKWRLSCAMRQDAAGEWRLVNGRALYNLRDDPEQRRDVAAEHPEVAAQLRADYEAWWELVSPRVGEEIPIPIGDPAVGTVLLTSHDWRRDSSAEAPIGPEGQGDDARAVWNQAQVHHGPELNGYWEVEIVRTGRYRLELRRWPREADLGLAEGIEGEPKPYSDALADGYGGGRALPIRRATVRMAGASASQQVEPAAPAAVFTLDLPAGPAHLETALTGEDGLEVGAYYVYAEPA